ncbi:DUF1659 domain-containing protein [Paenisporosarcina sp. TG20]|uniref:DUF1659 domain-containing protein n=1 Tax=Paenisporosarcina sp. TG20 TaxID=1211706 RepID=UPI0002F9B91D|nr:DUF1659 domain-containing protein [Paenisporosarcina sp. TG20]
MAIIDFKQAVVRMTFEAGYTPEGKVIKKASSYRNISQAATADQLGSVTSILSGFSSRPLLASEKIETGNIQN